MKPEDVACFAALAATSSPRTIASRLTVPDLSDATSSLFLILGDLADAWTESGEKTGPLIAEQLRNAQNGVTAAQNALAAVIASTPTPPGLTPAGRAAGPRPLLSAGEQAATTALALAEASRASKASIDTLVVVTGYTAVTCRNLAVLAGKASEDQSAAECLHTATRLLRQASQNSSHLAVACTTAKPEAQKARESKAHHNHISGADRNRD